MLVWQFWGENNIGVDRKMDGRNAVFNLHFTHTIDLCVNPIRLKEPGLLFETMVDISILKGNSSLLSVNLS